jgi:hypothetical protein
MSSINTNLSGGYYQLNGSSGNSTQANKSANIALATLLQATGDNNQAVNNSAYLLDLSPEAQKYLAGSQQSTASSTLGGGTQSFTLNSKQREEISAVLLKYKDAPFTQETYNKIQDELTSRGLSGQQLSMIDKATSFNPTQILVGALTGKGTQDSDPTGANAQAKVDNYMQQILGQWKNISTTADDAAEETSPDAVQAAGGASEG